MSNKQRYLARLDFTLQSIKPQLREALALCCTLRHDSKLDPEELRHAHMAGLGDMVSSLSLTCPGHLHLMVELFNLCVDIMHEGTDGQEAVKPPAN
jgi:hypothetical protein